MDNETLPLLISDSFDFDCNTRLSCFNECCKDLNQFLTPYDIIRLKKNLNLTSGEFLKTYTQSHTGPESGLPVVTLKPKENSGWLCPFVTDAGCLVYEDRPASCRTYPLARMISKSRESGEITERYVLIKESHCKGHCVKKSQTVSVWNRDQEIDEYNRMNDPMMEIISIKNRLNIKALDEKTGYFFYTACYDLDNFRKNAVANGLLDVFSVKRDDVLTLEDEKLLLLAYNWVVKILFKV